MCIHFTLHHSYSLKNYSIHQIDADHYYFDDEQTRKKINEFVDGNLLPLNELLLKQQHSKRLKLKLSITATAVEIMRQYRADAIDSLCALVQKLNAAIVQSSYYNSASEHFSLSEYKEQVQKHSILMQEVFCKTPIQNLCHDHHTGSKLSPVDYALVRNENHFQQLIENWDGDQTANTEFSSWKKGYDKRLLQKLYRLEKIAKCINNAAILNDWRKLQDVVYYSAGLQTESLTGIKNILSDFEIVLIKKYLASTKRKHKELPTIL